VLLGLHGCILRAVRTGVPYGCQKFTLADRKDRPYVRAQKMTPVRTGRMYGRSLRTGSVYQPSATRMGFCGHEWRSVGARGRQAGYEDVAIDFFYPSMRRSTCNIRHCIVPEAYAGVPPSAASDSKNSHPNTENDATSGFLAALECTNSLSAGALPEPHWESLQRSSRTPSWFKAVLLLRGGKDKGREGKGEEERREGDGLP